jgi:hypothetical protein
MKNIHKVSKSLNFKEKSKMVTRDERDRELLVYYDPALIHQK